MVREKKLEEPINPADIKSASTLRRRIGLFIVIVITLLAVYVGVIYATSPDAIRNPRFEHYHFRMQILVNGKAENFGENKYQATYETGNCNVELSDRPIHFHDHKDQFVHIHWDDMTGGLVLKNYGWNFIGGSDGTLGYRFDDLASIKNVYTHSNSLPVIPKEAKFYVYTGDETSFAERSFEQFKSQDFETFFGKKSNLDSENSTSLWNRIFPKALAHGGVDDGHEEAGQKSLEEINNLLGNIVIFVQKERPSYGQVKERFSKLEPLSSSSCAG